VNKAKEKHREEEEERLTIVQATPQAAATSISTKSLQREKNVVDRGSKGNKEKSSAETAERRKKAAATPPPNRLPAPPSPHLSRLIIPGNPSPYHLRLFIFLHAEHALYMFCKLEIN